MLALFMLELWTHGDWFKVALFCYATMCHGKSVDIINCSYIMYNIIITTTELMLLFSDFVSYFGIK